MFKKKVGKVSTAVKKYVKKQIAEEPEKKQWLTSLSILDTAGNPTFPNAVPISNTTGSRTCLNIQSAVIGKQGVQDNQRIGSKIKVHGIWIRGTLQIAANQGQSVSIKVRHLVVIDKRADGVVLPLIEVLADTATNLGVNAPYNEKYKHSKTILCDKTYELNSPMYAVAGPLYYQGQNTKTYSYKHMFKSPITLTFYTNNLTENITSVEGPAIYSYLVSESGGANAIDQYASLIFTDA